jgi:hypothetical protein
MFPQQSVASILKSCRASVMMSLLGGLAHDQLVGGADIDGLQGGVSERSLPHESENLSLIGH